MKLFAIGDLHLSDGSKPMDIFGPGWLGHFDKIKNDWLERVSAEDVVLLPGDLSWAMTLEGAAEHIQSVCALPGNKVFIKGNHDYWWNSLSRLRALLPQNAFALQNDSVAFENGLVIAGTRGWELKDKENSVYKRELIRLRLSLDDAMARNPKQLVVMTHYPPFEQPGLSTDLTKLIEAYPVTDVVYGHIHAGFNPQNVSRVAGVCYHLVSCDSLGFKLHQVT